MIINETIYFAGGMYPNGRGSVGVVFKMVSPSHTQIPYVLVNPNGHSLESFVNITKHHSHLYKVIRNEKGKIIASLVRESWEADSAGVIGIKEIELHKHEVEWIETGMESPWSV